MATHKTFVPPYKDKNMKLGEILQLKLHEFSGDVEDICDASAKNQNEKTVKPLLNAGDHRVAHGSVQGNGRASA